MWFCFVKISKYFFSVIENKYCYIPWYYFITLPINVSCTILLISFVSYIVQEIIEKFMPNYRGIFPSPLYYCTIQQKAVKISLVFLLKCIRYTVSYSTIFDVYINVDILATKPNDCFISSNIICYFIRLLPASWMTTAN